MPRTLGRNILRGFQEESCSERFWPALTSGGLIGITQVIFSLSLGSLVSSGDLAPFLPCDVGIALATAAIVLIVTALTSSVPGVMGSTQDTTSVALAVIAAVQEQGQ